MCAHYEYNAGYAPRTVHFERFPEQGLAVLVAEPEPGAVHTSGLYIELYSIANGQARLVDMRATPSDPLDPELELGSFERDRAIRSRISTVGIPGPSGSMFGLR
jgi:hypothetical protein